MLFSESESHEELSASDDRPMAARVRPQTFNDIFGQDKIWGPNAPLRKIVEQDRFHSLIFWGPPGSGKTSLANLIGQSSGRKLVTLSAVHAGVKDMRKVMQGSEAAQRQGAKACILFMDEVHRLSKNQQDVLLPSLEAGTVKFIGATTENPSFEVNSAINSRSFVFRLEKIANSAMVALLRNALKKPHSGFSERRIDEEVFDVIALSAGGDARRALNLLEAILLTTDKDKDPLGREELAALKDTFPTLLYDKKADQHYDTASALIKSIRASHPDAAIYYLARMLDAGEDPKFIARRLIVAASEDIGNANPHGLGFALAAAEAVHWVGMPEARIILAQICLFLASSPKSNRAYLAINKALVDVKKWGALDIPLHLRNAPTEMMKQLGYSKGYVYAHDDVEGARDLEYLPKELKGSRYYQPSEHGFEKQMQQTLARLRPHKD